MRIKKAALQDSGLRFTGRMVEGYAATFGNVDYEGHIIQKGAFRKTLAENGHRVKALWQHNWDMPLGPVLDLREDDKGLYVRFAISETSYGNDVVKLLEDFGKTGVEELFPMSFYGDILQERRETFGGRAVRVLTELRLLDVSLVTFPGNEQAQAVALKSVSRGADLPLAGRQSRWDADAAVGRVYSFAGGAEDTDWYRYGSAFLWYAPDVDDSIERYRLPFADVIEGELRAVPAALASYAEDLPGALERAGIPSEDLGSVQRKISRYYSTMATEFADDSYTVPWAVERGRAWHTVRKEYMADGSVVLRLGETLRASVYEVLNWQATSWLAQGLLTEDVYQALRSAADQAVSVVMAAVPEEVRQQPLSVIPDWLSWVTMGPMIANEVAYKEYERGISDAGRVGPDTSVLPTHPTREELRARLSTLQARMQGVKT